MFTDIMKEVENQECNLIFFRLWTLTFLFPLLVIPITFEDSVQKFQYRQLRLLHKGFQTQIQLKPKELISNYFKLALYN